MSTRQSIKTIRGERTIDGAGVHRVRALFGPGDEITVTAGHENPLRMLFFSGKKLGERSPGAGRS